MPVFVGAGTSSFMKGSDGVGVSTATTTQRNALSGVRQGQLIYNETTNLMEYYNGTTWVLLIQHQQLAVLIIQILQKHKSQLVLI